MVPIHLLWKRHPSWSTKVSVQSEGTGKRSRLDDEGTYAQPKEMLPNLFRTFQKKLVPPRLLAVLSRLSHAPQSSCHRKTSAPEFSTPQGYDFRTNRCHDILKEPHNRRKECFVCHKKVPYHCLTCDVFLCVEKDSPHSTTCFHKFHFNKSICCEAQSR